MEYGMILQVLAANQLSCSLQKYVGTVRLQELWSRMRTWCFETMEAADSNPSKSRGKSMDFTIKYNYGKSPFLMGKSTISMAIFHCYVSSPKGTWYWYSMDWFCWENLNRKPWFLPSNWSGFPVKFPIIQFYEQSVLGIPSGYDIATSPWKDPPISKFGKPSISIRAIEKPWRTVTVITRPGKSHQNHNFCWFFIPLNHH